MKNETERLREIDSIERTLSGVKKRLLVENEPGTIKYLQEVQTITQEVLYTKQEEWNIFMLNERTPAHLIEDLRKTKKIEKDNDGMWRYK